MECKKVVLATLGLKLALLNKPFHQAVYIPLIVDVEIAETVVQSKFCIKCEILKKTYCKIINKSFFVKECEDGFKKIYLKNK